MLMSADRLIGSMDYSTNFQKEFFLLLMIAEQFRLHQIVLIAVEILNS